MTFAMKKNSILRNTDTDDSDDSRRRRDTRLSGAEGVGLSVAEGGTREIARDRERARGKRERILLSQSLRRHRWSAPRARWPPRRRGVCGDFLTPAHLCVRETNECVYVCRVCACRDGGFGMPVPVACEADVARMCGVQRAARPRGQN